MSNTNEPMNNFKYGSLWDCKNRMADVKWTFIKKDTPPFKGVNVLVRFQSGLQCTSLETPCLNTMFESAITEISFEIVIMELKSTQIGIFHPCKLALQDFTLFEIGIMGLRHFWNWDYGITGPPLWEPLCYAIPCWFCWCVEKKVPIGVNIVEAFVYSYEWYKMNHIYS